MRLRTRRRGLGPALVVASAVAIALGLIASATGALSGAERSSIDARFSIRGTQAIPRDVAVVAIDEATLSTLKTQFPFSRDLHTRLIKRLVADGARVIAYDVQFTEPTNQKDDGNLMQAVFDAHRVVLAANAVDVRPGHRGETNVFGGTRIPGAGIGDVGTDPAPDGVLRRFRYETSGLRDFAVLAAQAGGHQVSPSQFPAAGAWIDYLGPNKTVSTYSFISVLRGRHANDLRGRFVVVGATDTTLKDYYPTPTSPVMAGPEIQATKIHALLNGLPLSSTGDLLTLVLIVALGLTAPLAAWRLGVLGAVCAAAAIGVLVAVGAQIAFNNGHIVPVAAPLLALALGTIGAVAATAFYAALDRERTRTLFARFVPAPVVDQVLTQAQSQDGVRLGGTLVEVTVLFCDLRGSTPLVETLGASRGIEVVNRYLTAMTEAILAEGGTLAGFRGDGLMAVFGAPLEQPGHGAGRSPPPTRWPGRSSTRSTNGCARPRSAMTCRSASASARASSWPATSARRSAWSTRSSA